MGVVLSGSNSSSRGGGAFPRRRGGIRGACCLRVDFFELEHICVIEAHVALCPQFFWGVVWDILKEKSCIFDDFDFFGFFLNSSHFQKSQKS